MKINKEILHLYINGNINTTIYTDGTLVKECDGEPKPNFPSSMDVKITDYCDAKCSYCHEKSTEIGKDGDLNKLLNVLSVLPSGPEIACGGGNPLSHPDFTMFLESLKKQGLVANVTINQKHLNPYKDLILNIINNDLIKGIGISYTSEKYLEDVKPIIELTDNIIFHVIMGINTIEQLDTLNEFCKLYNKKCKVLILGYKNYGFGINYYLKNKKIEDNKYKWFIKIGKYIKKNNYILSFDNLAIQQLKLDRFFTKEAWETFYMGDDGKYTCYLDAINQVYAKSSTSDNRVSFDKMNLIEYFKSLNEI